MSLDDLKIEIFPGLNASPRAATAEEGGNGSDIIQRFNGLIDEVSILVDEVARLSVSSLSEPTTWYVDPANGDDVNTGLAADQAFSSIQSALSLATRHTGERTIQLLDGNYGSIFAVPSFVPTSQYDQITIQGNAASKSAVQLGGAAGGVTFYGSGKYLLKDLTLNGRPTTTYQYPGYPALSVINASVELQGVNFGTGSVHQHIDCKDRASIKIYGDYAIGGNATIHLGLDSYSFLEIYPQFAEEFTRPALITLDSSVTSFSTFTSLASYSYLLTHGATFSANSVTGKKFNARASIIDTGTGDATLFPGNQAGELSAGGQYF